MARARRGDEDPFPLRGTTLGEDPFPLKVAVKKQIAGRWVKGKGSYKALQIGPFVRLTATGTLNHMNASAVLVKSPLAVFPPIYGLFFYIPEVDIPAQNPFVVHTFFFASDTVDVVIVYDVGEKHKVKVDQAIE